MKSSYKQTKKYLLETLGSFLVSTAGVDTFETEVFPLDSFVIGKLICSYPSGVKLAYTVTQNSTFSEVEAVEGIK